MGIVRLRTEDLIDYDTEAQYVFIHSMKATAGIHRHEYYEIFLVVSGTAVHIVNNIRQRLMEGALVFIRPDDVHYYLRDQAEDAQIINLAFSEGTMRALFGFLGEGLHPDRLLHGDEPPRVQLDRCECNIVMTMLEEFEIAQRTRRPEDARMLLRAMLSEIFTKYFSPENRERKASRPEWMTMLYREMQRKENLAEGITAMVRLSGMTHEYLCRQYKTHMNMTPSQFVNSLRLRYASNLLVNSDEEILDIALEVGFESLSHFYHVFKKQYGISPAVFRKLGNRNLVS